MKKVLIAEDDGVLYLFESIYGYNKFVADHNTISYNAKVNLCEYEVFNYEGLVIKFKKIYPEYLK